MSVEMCDCGYAPAAGVNGFDYGHQQFCRTCYVAVVRRIEREDRERGPKR